MNVHADALRRCLATGPKSGTEMAEKIGLSQPTVSRALAAMGDDVIKLGQRKFTRYVLRDRSNGFNDIPVYRVTSLGQIETLGTLQAIRPEGFVFMQANGQAQLSAGLPWWLQDSRPQGFLGRAYAAHHGASLGLPRQLHEWTDAHCLQALLLHGHDGVGNLLIGTKARDAFLNLAEPRPIRQKNKLATYAALALGAAEGDSPGSSAGGEQPKFTAYAETPQGAAHVLVKFSEPQDSPTSQRWRDLLLAEHLALETLREQHFPAAESAIYDYQGQRFLEVKRFDRIAALGRKAIISLTACDAEFVGQAQQPWPVITQALAKQSVITQTAADMAEILWAFGTLIGNSDMHHGNLSFMTDHGRPYDLAPAYDMTPMSFAPTRSGRLPHTISPHTLHPTVSANSWRCAQTFAHIYFEKLQACHEFNQSFQICLEALAQHIRALSTQINRLA